MIQDLTLTNFRSYSKKTFEFSPQTTIFIGPNGAGKTNILEALFLLSPGKSFRADSDQEMIKWNSDLSLVTCHLSQNVELEIMITQGQVMGQKTPVKKYKINGVGKRMVDFVGNLKTVLFWPEDLTLVTGTPSKRRRYLDFVLTQTDWEYRRNLYSYEKGLRQRNRLLEKIRENQAQEPQLLFWDQLLIKCGNYISQKRQFLIDFINQTQKPFGGFSIKYDYSFISIDRLAQYANEEIAAAITLVGPHRDDLIFLQNTDHDMSKFASRGEQRLLILWLKLAELTFIEKATNQKPVLLLDDIFSELDHEHREQVLKIINLQQTVLTTADKHFLPDSLVKNSKMIELD